MIETITRYIGPPQGLLIGILLIILNKRVSHQLQALLEKFPKYDKSIFKDFSIRPAFITITGIIYCLIAALGALELFQQP